MSIMTLHERRSQDLHVQLLWNSATGRVYVKVRDPFTRDLFVVEPEAFDALDAFYHPFCYAAVAEIAGQSAAIPTTLDFDRRPPTTAPKSERRPDLALRRDASAPGAQQA